MIGELSGDEITSPYDLCIEIQRHNRTSSQQYSHLVRQHLRRRAVSTRLHPSALSLARHVRLLGWKGFLVVSYHGIREVDEIANSHPAASGGGSRRVLFHGKQGVDGSMEAVDSSSKRMN